MESSITIQLSEKLIPVLSDKELQDIVAYFTVYEKYADAFTEKATEELKDHPVFGKIIRDTPKEITEATNKLSRDLQRDAILNNKWLPYIEYQIEQGIAYAKMGLDFKSWYEVITLARNFMSPYLHQEYGSGTKFLSALNGMNSFMDIAMSIIGEAYLLEKKQIIQRINKQLEQKVIERTEQLEAANKELEAFTYSVSHDLRAPLRAINGYALMLHEDYETKLDDEGKRLIDTIRHNTIKMGTLIDDLLALSKLGRKELQNTKIQMNELVNNVLSDIAILFTNRAEVQIGKLHDVKADYSLLYQVMFNLISNAIKYSSKETKPVIEIFSEEKNGDIIFSVKDNGVGFDMRYYDKLFGVFQRLHRQNEFEGVGVGLAIVQRIIAKHGGKVWAEGKVNEGAQFNFSLMVN